MKHTENQEKSYVFDLNMKIPRIGDGILVNIQIM